MKQKNIKDNLPQNLIKIVLFVVATILILESFPRESRFRYNFQEGKPWRYGLMTAPYDFLIYKSDKEFKLETDSMLRGFQPYLTLDTNAFTSVRNQLRTDFLTNLQITVPPHYLTYLTDQLDNIYKAGILSVNNFEELQKDSVTSVMIVQNKVVQARALSSVFTTKAAYEALFQNLPSDIHANVLKRCKLNKYIVENVGPDKLSTGWAKENLLKKISLTSGVIQRGERIIDRGEIISPEAYKVLCSLKKVAEKRAEQAGDNGVLFGQAVLVFGLFTILFLFLWFFRPFIYERKSNVVFILILTTGLVLLTSLVVHTGYLNVYMIPYVILPIMVRTFFDSRTALFAHIITVLISSTIVAYPYEFLLIQIAAGMVSVYSLKDLTQRSQLAFCAILVVLTYCIMYLGVSLVEEGYIERINWKIFAYFLVNGCLMLTSYLLIFLFEWIFGYTSNVTLVELSNINNPLLREFSETCPGSFQHSMQVSNLATAAAQEINANVQLVRTGALYHDIGKMANPIYFTENQSGINPHDKLTSEESAKVISSHVPEGLRIALKHGLPLVIRDCIRTHHGNGPVRYFYNVYKQTHAHETVPAVFFYTGVNPSTKETAILMMSDAVEASSRSLKEYSEAEISKLVERIIDMQIREGSYKNVPMTFRDLEKVKSVFKLKLQTIYHTRIAYPEMPAALPPIVQN